MGKYKDQFFEALLEEDEKKLDESVYARGFRKSGITGENIFGLIKDIQEYTADMDKEEAVEEAVFATADYVKDGHL